MTLVEVSCRRLLRLAAVLLRHALANALGSRPHRWRWLARRLPGGEMTEPERLRAILEQMGGTFLKFGQMLAQQPDVLPVEYCNALFNLLDRVPPFPYAEVEEVFVEELGRTPAELFDAFEPQPIASASIGQVHVADLGGRKLAVKVQRPTAERDFGGDVRLMELAMTLIRRLRLRRFAFLLEPMSDFIEWTSEELDYRCEARFMAALARGSRARPHQRVPEVFAAYTTRRILVMEFFAAVTVLDYLRAVEKNGEATEQTLQRLARGGFDPERFAAHLIDNFFEQAFIRGLFHADPHPANLMILAGNVVGYLDLGITGTLNPYSRRQLAAMTLAYTRGDVEGMCAAFHRVSLADETAAKRFREGMLRLSEDWYERAGTGLRLRKSFTAVMLEMLRLSRATDVWGQRDLVKYIRSVVAIDGLLARCVPHLDVSAHLERACARYIGQMAWGTAASPSSLLVTSAAGVRRMLAGGFRAAALFDRVARGELPLRAELAPPAADGAGTRPWEVVVLAVLILALALMITGPGAAAEFGLNLFTAQTLLLGAALARLVGTVRGLT